MIPTTMGLALGERVRQLRVARGLSVIELARLSAMHPTSVTRLERGGRGHNPQLDTVLQLAEALGVKPTAIFSALDDLCVRPYDKSLTCWTTCALDRTSSG